ncbi:hypothetical protein TrRE_jg10036 [Triparma retinervis]|uniref:Uncharacterized protein n=1 Tax=Triparma retinervis TaxID=2557542 RepID=A0A9W7G261_9STRA|nr:hypothetical protein TrRE_jg10036 [Triparma retinervis]
METVVMETVVMETVVMETVVMETVVMETVAMQGVVMETAARETVAMETVAKETVARETVAMEDNACLLLVYSLTRESFVSTFLSPQMPDTAKLEEIWERNTISGSKPSGVNDAASGVRVGDRVRGVGDKAFVRKEGEDDNEALRRAVGTIVGMEGTVVMHLSR